MLQIPFLRIAGTKSKGQSAPHINRAQMNYYPRYLNWEVSGKTWVDWSGRISQILKLSFLKTKQLLRWLPLHVQQI